MIVLHSGFAGAPLFLDSIHSEIRKTCIAYVLKKYLLPYDFQVWKGILRLNCADKVDPTFGAKHLMIRTQNNNTYINVDSRQGIFLKTL